MKTHKNTFHAAIAAAMASTALLGSTSAQACSGDGGQTIGSVCAVATSFCPAPQYMLAAGQTLAINSYTALFSLIGTNYGGDGRTNFKLPDLRGRMPMGAGQGPGQPSYPLGHMAGSSSITIPQQALPSHTHEATFTSTGANPIEVTVPVSGKTAGNAITPDSTHSYMAGTAGGPGSAAMWADAMEGSASVSGVSASGGGATGTVTVGPTGGNQSFSHLPPVNTFNYCIAVDGIYPQRP